MSESVKCQNESLNSETEIEPLKYKQQKKVRQRDTRFHYY